MKSKGPNGQDIDFSSQDKVERFQPQIDIILKTIGYPEALVTDESTLNDFCGYSDLAMHKCLKKLKSKLGISAKGSDTLVSIAEKLAGGGIPPAA